MSRRNEIVRVVVALVVGAGLWVSGTSSLVVSSVQAQETDEQSASSEREGPSDSDVNPGDVSRSGDEQAGDESAGEGASESGDSSGKEEKKKKTSKKATEESKEKSKEKSKQSEKKTLPIPEGADKQFRAELKEFRRVYGRYSDEIKDYQKTVDSLVDAEYKKRKAEITEEYDRRADQLKSIERERRREAIERFKVFLRRHPNRPVYTPDAMYRLAELYFEKANDKYLQADERYQKEMERYQAGRRPSPPESPTKDFTKTIETFEKLIREWPDYRLLDGAYYLLAYCHEQMGHPRKARDLFAELIVKRPQSEFVPEAWLRIGEYHFDRSDDPKEIELARNAYRQSMKYEQSKYFDKALYKLAWSNYRLDDFDKAIKNFERLVEWKDEEGDKSGSVLRKEAIRYMAISLAEEDWDLDREVDEGFVMPRIKKYLGEGKPYEREVLKQLVGVLIERTRNERAVEVIRYTLAKYPNHPKNPKLHKKMIKALMRPPQKVDEAFEERRRLIDLYGPESDWYAYQKKQGNEEAVEYGQQLIGENLIQAATWYHEQAQKLKDKAKVKQDPALLKKSRERYAKAAHAYKKFLKRYPNDKDIYRWNFYYADSLYYAGKYQKAYKQYRVVRELDIRDNKFQADAGFNAVKALEFRIKKLVDQGKLPESVVPSEGREEARKAAKQQKKQGGKEGQDKEDERTDQKKPEIKKKAVPDIVKRYVTAMDRYVVLQLDYKDQTDLAPKFAFNAAKIFYDYKHYDAARTRFEWIVNNYPDREEAYLAGSLLLETYRQEKRYDQLAKWADKLSGVLKGEQAEAVKKEVREFKLGAMFKSAEKLFDQEKYEKAAEEYVKLVDKAPDHENAPRALNNAAVAYEEIKKYQSALELYRRVYREYPDSPLSGYALYRVAVNSERFFEYDEAIRTYKLFYDKYQGDTPKELRDMGFKLDEKRPKALLSSAVLAENLQRYEEAAERYEKFVERYPNNDEAPSAQWQAVESWKKAGDTQAMFDAFETYKREFGSDPENADRVLEGMMRRAEYYEEQGREERAADQYREIIETFKKRGIEPGTDPAFYAAKAEFQLAERTFADWKQIQTKSQNVDRQKEVLKKKIEEQKKVASAFKEVWSYKNLEYTLASGYRIGSLYQQMAEFIYNIPCPFQSGSKKCMMYRTQLDKQARPLEEKAIDRWKETIQKARQSKIVNEWTKKTLKSLNEYRPKEFPLYKESRTAKQPRTVTGRSMLRSVPEEPKADEESDESGDESKESSSSKDSNGDS